MIGGYVKAKVIGDPVNTKKVGIRVPCMYIVNGQKLFIQNVKDNFLFIL